MCQILDFGPGNCCHFILRILYQVFYFSLQSSSSAAVLLLCHHTDLSFFLATEQPTGVSNIIKDRYG